MRIARKAAAAAIVRGGLVRLLGGNFLPTLGNIVLLTRRRARSTMGRYRHANGRGGKTGERKEKGSGGMLGAFRS